MVELMLGPVLRHVGETAVTVWVETDGPCQVDVLGRVARTFAVHGQHYALVVVDGLAPGSRLPYQVRLDGEVAWPSSSDDRGYPPSVLRTLDPSRPLRLLFGSCRHATPASLGEEFGYAPDALDTYAARMARTDPDAWPDAVLLLGDQVYADDTSPGTAEFIRSRRDPSQPPGLEVADFEEYSALYRESWGDPDIRWLLANLPSAMIFDDHDIRDDWNTSYSWRREIEATPWWRTRILGGLASYWVYQHLGNLSPADLEGDEVYQAVLRATDGAAVLERLAGRSDDEVDTVDAANSGAGTRWSFRLDYGRTRVVFVDSRCGRVLAEDVRAMISDEEFDWVAEQFDGDYDHLVVASSLPWLLPWAIHHLEEWNEALCAGSRGHALARVSERVRRLADLEHWASFRASFDRLGRLLASAARGERGGRPASVSVLSGDVHHAYVARAVFDPPTAAPVYQVVVSPVHQRVPTVIRYGFTLGWSRAAAAMARPLARWARVPRPSVRWHRLAGPFYGNELGTMLLDGRVARFQLERAERAADGTPELVVVAQVPLAWSDAASGAFATAGATRREVVPNRAETPAG